MSARNKIFWAANVRTKSFKERLEAAAAGGFSEMSIFPIDVKHFTSTGVTLLQLRQQAAEQGVRISVLDPFAMWVPNTTPASWSTPSDLEFVNFSEDDIFRMADGLGVESVNLIETFGNVLDTEAAAERFAKLATRCAAHGLRIQLEFMPFSGIPDIRKAWEIVRLANVTNGGLTFDTWHYYRGKVDDDLLHNIPGDRIFQIQFADAKWQLNGTLVEDLLHYRLFPGEGDFPLKALAKTLMASGTDAAVGVELFSDRIDAMTPKEAGTKVAESLNNLLAEI